VTLPSGWAIARVDELAGPGGLVNDGDWVESKDQDPSGTVRLTQLADVGEGNFRDRSARFMTKKAADSLRCTYLEPGDVLIARMPDPIGRACQFPGLGQPAVTAVDVMIWRSDGQLANAAWFVRWINSPIVRQAMTDGAGGTTRQRIAGGRIKELELPLPPLAEQCRIVAKLDALTTRLTRARTELTRLPILTERYRQAALAAAFANETGTVVELGTLALPSASIRYGVLQPGDEKGVGVQMIRVCDLQNMRVAWPELRRIAPEIDRRFAGARVQNGDVLLSVVGTIGRVAIVTGMTEPTNIARAVARLRPDPSKVLPIWLALRLASPDCQESFAGDAREVARKTLNVSLIKTVPITVPSLPVQAETVRRIEAAFARADRLEAEAARAALLLGRLETAILAKAFRGELVPQDPADEPASALLARVRQSRGAAAKTKRGPRAAHGTS